MNQTIKSVGSRKRNRRASPAKRRGRGTPGPTSTGTEIVLRAMLAAGPPQEPERETAYQEWLRVLKFLADNPRPKRSD